MRILALEFSSPCRNAAVAECVELEAAPAMPASRGGDGDWLRFLAPGTQWRCLATAMDSQEQFEPLRLVRTVLNQAAVERSAVQALAVGLGPGSYTGIRMAIGLAQGWQLARSITLFGVSSVDAVAVGLWQEQRYGRCTVAVDAQRQELYLTRYDLRPEGIQVLEPVHLAPIQEAVNRSAAGELVVGPEVRQWCPAGQVVNPTSTAVLALALAQRQAIPGEQLEPIYLRETRFVKAPPPRWPT